jgi:hypothetical protein
MPWLPILIVVVLLLAWLEVDQGLKNAAPPPEATTTQVIPGG